MQKPGIKTISQLCGYSEGNLLQTMAKCVALITLFGLKRGWIDINGNKLLDDEILKDFVLKKIR